MKLLYTPRFFDPAEADLTYAPDIAGALREGVEFGKANHLQSADILLQRGIGRLLEMTDLQLDFCEGGRLPVTGARKVVLRTCERLINGVVEDYYAGLLISFDEHGHFHISFDHNWENESGELLDLSKHGRAAILTRNEKYSPAFTATAFGPNGPYEVGRFRSRFNRQDTVDYAVYLQVMGQGPIWVFVPHCVAGTDGVNLHPLLAETIAFACGVRSITPTIVRKGHLVDTDWFGPLEPCRPRYPDGVFRNDIIAEMNRFSAVEFSGIAEDFCDFAMKKQTLDAFSRFELNSKKLRFVTDLTAPIVPNAAHVVAQNEAAKKVGVKFIMHDTPFSES